ncbi:MAG TPA: hypothetical protein DEQ80_02150 [Anaerolinea thermolimosa]|uniref:Uncharacterized protein n=1 Tax=Anaerolinea thermolimosa TaxID=229919 RepID=A0A3D1JDI3_9CHLR|nr:hypothetical protein [Anaerolinea thermolimosa]GAP07636.1 hypothetical protein ATHL_02522 [Anaerolinea thermolimosa]HCE16639.1 hypothetical protein [Anaerolinea thermolimosa]
MQRKDLPIILLSMWVGGASVFSALGVFQNVVIRGFWVFILLIAVWLAITCFVHRLIQRWLALWLNAFSRMAQWGLIIGCLLAGFASLWILPITRTPMRYFPPSNELKLEVTGKRNPASSGNVVRVRSWRDGAREAIDLRTFDEARGWTFAPEMIYSSGEDAEPLVWRGGLLGRGYLGLLTGPDEGIVRITWKGESQEVDLYTPERTLKVIKLPGPGLPGRYFWLAACLYATAIGFWLLVSLLWFASHPPREGARVHLGWKALGFALPMFAVWLGYLLVFFPGVLSPDTIHQFRMLYGLEAVIDWHPPIHTFLMKGLLALWNSPAIVALVQMGVLSLVVAWGLGELVAYGLPLRAAWLVAGLFALSPVNGIMSITLWKDIWYAIFAMILFLLMLKMVLSRGQWIERPGAWVAFGLVSALTALFRHNGIALAVGCLIITLLIFRRAWKRIAGAGVLFLLVFGVVSGPVYQWAGVKRVSNVLRDTIFLHHIGAHVASGTPLTDEERGYLNALNPLSNWVYYCGSVNSLFFIPEFNGELFAANSSKNLKIFLDLLVRDPGVELRHWQCVSGFVWRIFDPLKTTHLMIYRDEDAKVRWVETNPFGIHEASKLPGMVEPLFRFLRWSDGWPRMSWIWGPALYLYLTLFAVCVFALRRRTFTALLAGVPATIQSLVLMVVAIAPDFRYQYPVYLMGLFSLALLWMPVVKYPSERENL